jgi:hypothetical protein
MRNRPINPSQQSQRQGLRLIGGVLAVVGGILTAIGLFSFFGAFGGGGMPSLFWCAFVGLPMLGIGVQMLKAGYVGTIARYVAGETAPVASDTLNYMAGETKEGIRDVAAAIGAGIRGKAAGTQVACSKCSHPNDADARFCDQCGAAMPRRQECPKCRTVSDAGARFCNGCGERLAAAG